MDITVINNGTNDLRVIYEGGETVVSHSQSVGFNGGLVEIRELGIGADVEEIRKQISPVADGG